MPDSFGSSDTPLYCDSDLDCDSDSFDSLAHAQIPSDNFVEPFVPDSYSFDTTADFSDLLRPHPHDDFETLFDAYFNLHVRLNRLERVFSSPQNFYDRVYRHHHSPLSD